MERAKRTKSAKPATKVEKVEVVEVEVPGDEQAEIETKEYGYVPLYATTFAEYDMSVEAQKMRAEVYDLGQVFEQLIRNILYDADVADKASAMNKLVVDYAIRTKALVTTKEQTAPQPTTAEEVTVAGTVTQTADGETSDFFLFKEESGRLRWFAVYSNNYRDDDGVPEIISEKSHKAFAYLVKEGVVPYPELWHWHIPGTRWGVADHLDYENGMAYATGLVDVGHEKEAEILAGMDILVSHGMPIPYILRDEADPSVIDFHITSEISPLPSTKAANKITGFFTQ